jgi:plastocyanin
MGGVWSTPKGAAAQKPAAAEPANAEAEAAGLTGKVLFKGEAPKRERLDTKGAPGCDQHEAPLSEDVVVNDDGTLRNVVVYVKEGLDPGAADRAPVPARAVTMDQRGCQYVPHVVALRVGQPLTVGNSDPTLHNVHGFPFDNAPFNVLQNTKGASNTFKFAVAEEAISLKCDVHPWMRAWIFVFDHPYYAITGADGSFALPALPPGEYKLVAWHEKFGTREQQVKVEVGQAPPAVEFTFEAPQK